MLLWRHNADNIDQISVCSLESEGHAIACGGAGMDDGKEKESPPIRMRMTCLMWIAILVLIPLIARACVLLL